MVDHPRLFQNVMRFAFAGILVSIGFFVLSILISASRHASVQAEEKQSAMAVWDNDIKGDPNVVASGMAGAADDLVRNTNSMRVSLRAATESVTESTAKSVSSAAKSTLNGVTGAAKGVGGGVAFAGRIIGSGLGFVGRGIFSGVGFVLSIPGNIIGFVTDSPVVSHVIRPADHVDVPIIDPDSPELKAALAALPAEPAAPAVPAAVPVAPAVNQGPQWPIHGQITTYFGVSHWPFQETHTGIDISDARTPGTTPVKPFRPGKVIERVSSDYGLGNHVVIDHGSGVTSVYAHLHSIFVHVGQDVGLETVLGMEGTTGASTGTHLHFEIRVNGQATDPRQFISGTP
jgi:hypothetical protein